MANSPVSKKYTLDYQPDKLIPAGWGAYIRMVIKRNPRLWAFLLFTDVIHAVRYPVAFYFIGKAIDLLLNSGSSSHIPDGVWHYCALIFGTLFVGEMCHLLPHYYTFDWMKRARATLRSDMLAYTLDHSYTYFQNHFAGGLARKISEGVEKVPQLNTQLRWEIFLPVVGMISSAGLLFEVSWIYGVAAFGFLLCIVTPIFLKRKKLLQKIEHYSDIRSQVSGQIVDTVSNIAAVKAYANESREMDEHNRITEQEMQAWHKMIRLWLLLDNYRRMTLVIFGAGMMVACVVGYQNGLLSVGEIATVMGISFNFTGMAWMMSFGIIHVSESLGYLSDTLKTIVNPHNITDAQNAKPLQVKDGRIDFEQVNFHYGDNPVFVDLQLTVAAHERIGLIGASGAGKTTLVNLLQRFFDVQQGQICIDGQDIATITQQSLRAQIATIPQDTSLFHRTLRDNIRYGKLGASDADVEAAAKKAHAHDFIMQLPLGYETPVGERGIKLSGGQRQRIAIARAVLKNAPILILDEATSALDSESEKRIQEGLHELMQGRTVIAIAHRLSTISHMDRLVVMDAGAIVEQGTHSELLAANGVYARLWNMQSGGFLPE
ncbi:MAG: ABC transporter ATP-binding protein/permease [Alphaproteobacteria bacterium]|nr:ABC transporter ATP-binding protein/permease [Alphaproteobacteria bacterium]